MANFSASVDTYANWSASSRVPVLGEYCLESDTGGVRVGDGVNTWSNLVPYQGSKDPEWFNVNANTLRSMRMLLNKAKRGVNAHLIVLGASVDTGVPTEGAQGSYPWLTYKAIIGTGVPPGGTGWVPAFNNAGDTRWTTNGFPTTGGVATLTRTSTASAQAQTFTSPLPGDKLQVAVITGSGSFTPTIDGVLGPISTSAANTTTNSITLTGSAVAGGMTVYSYTLPQSGSHIITITASTATAVNLVAIRLYRTSGGLELTNFAISGGLSTAMLPTAATGAPGSAVPALFPTATPNSVVIIGLDPIYNDGFTTATAAADVARTKARYQTIISGLQGNGHQIILTLPGQPNPAGASNAASWDLWRQAAYQLATQYGVPLMDMTLRWKDNATAVAAGYMADDVHSTPRGYEDWAGCLLALLTEGYEIGPDAADPGVIPAVLQSSFIRFGGVGWQIPGYSKDANGYVHLHGMIGSPANTTWLNTTMFTLPVGYRPSNTRLMNAISSIGNMRIDIGVAGLVVPVNGVSAAASGAWISLEGISFLADL